MEKGVPIRSISRSISVLQAINLHGSLSMMGISRQGQLPYATACRIVQTLLHEGMIEQEPYRKLYRPTALVQSLAHGYQAGNHLVSAAASHIRALTREVGWPVSLTMRVGNNVVVRDCTHAETSLTFELYHPGYTLPLLECASGLICLSQMSQERFDNFLRWAAPEEGDDVSRFGFLELPERLAKIREQGYAAYGRGRHNRTPGKTSSLAVPIFHNGHFEGALTLIYFAASMSQVEAVASYLDALKAKAELISLELGDDN